MDNNNVDLLIQDNYFFNSPGSDECEFSRDTEERINLVVSHMYKQYQEYLQSTINTTQIFENLLDEMLKVTCCIKNAWEKRHMNSSQVFCEIDADRSVGILSVLWHSISFTTRGNTKPQALQRTDESPLFTGRIIALNGDFQDAALEIMDQEYPDILKCEIGSLYIPHDRNIPAIMNLRHLPDTEFHFNQADAHKQFLLKIIEVICGGGIFHETYDDQYDE